MRTRLSVKEKKKYWWEDRKKTNGESINHVLEINL